MVKKLIFWSPPYFYFRFRLYGHRDGRFCLIFACTAQMVQMDFLAASRARIVGLRLELKPEVVFKVQKQKMARYASFCLIMGPFKEEVPVFARLWPIRVRVRVSFTTGVVRSAILATAGLLVCNRLHFVTCA